MKFKTTREDYELAVKEMEEGKILDFSCLVAQTVRRVTGRSCQVDCHFVKFHDNPEVKYNLPIMVSEAVMAFDAATKVVGPDYTRRKMVKDGFTELEFELPID